MRAVVLALLLPAPAAAWEFSPSPVCTISHETPSASVAVTWDPRQPEPYAIRVTRTDPWPEAPVFAIDYAGPGALVISTNRQRLTDGGRTVTVTDEGFGNVLSGLEFNATATAILGPAREVFPLDGAAEAVREFRACTAAVVS